MRLLKILSCSLALALALAAACSSSTDPARLDGPYDGTPQSRPRVFASNLTYLGSFRVPNHDGSGSQNNSFAYGGTALSYYPARNSLFYGGHDWYQELGEIEIPQTLSSSSTATVLQHLNDATGGRMNDVDEGTVKLGGSLVYNGRLIVTAYSYYDADGNQSRSHFVAANLSTAGAGVSGPFAVTGAANPRSKAGYMGIIPEEWRALLGGPALTGNCCLSIISASSAGPSITVFDPDDVGVVTPVPGATLLFYPLGNATTQSGTTQNQIFVQSDVIAGVAFPPGTRSVLFFGRHGTGAYCYGPGTSNPSLAGQPSGEGDDWCYDPAQSSKGTHAYPYRHQVWAYDANDLLEVRSGTREPWDVTPYAVWPLNEMDASGGAGIRGAAFDPETGRVFITEAYGEDPVVHVYRVCTNSAC